MIRAGVVQHPEQWPFCGYNEIRLRPKRYRLPDHKALAVNCGCSHASEEFREMYLHWVEVALSVKSVQREPAWSECIAVGSKGFVEEIYGKLGRRARGREISEDGDTCTLSEHKTSYSTDFGHQSSRLSTENEYGWNY